MTLFDTHAHLDFPQFDADREEVLARAAAAGVSWLLNPGADLESSRRAVDLAGRHTHLFAAVGIHPHEASSCAPAAIAELRVLARREHVVAIGEIGLDYYRDLSPRDAQRQAFRQQLDLSAELGLPIIVHDRDAHADVLEILSDYRSALRPAAGVFHAFAGDGAMAAQVVEWGYCIAVGGPITFQNARRTPALLPAVPVERLLLETDCPYLTPHPYRGQRNEPAHLPLVARRLAEIMGLAYERVAAQTTENARRLFGLP